MHMLKNNTTFVKKQHSTQLKDGDSLFSSLATIVRSNKKIVREKIADWLRANPNTPLSQSCTLSEFVMYETGEVWSVYCARMQREGTWAGLPELVAASQIWHRIIRVFENVGDGIFHLRAVLGEEGFLIAPIDLALGSDHFDVLPRRARCRRPRPRRSPRTDPRSLSRLTTSPPSPTARST